MTDTEHPLDRTLRILRDCGELELAVRQIAEYIIDREKQEPQFGAVRQVERARPLGGYSLPILQQYLAPGEWVDVPYVSEQEQKQ